jgi:hypothetical protein
MNMDYINEVKTESSKEGRRVENAARLDFFARRRSFLEDGSRSVQAD